MPARAALTALPADASLLLFSYAGSKKSLPLRLADVQTRATARFGSAPRALVVPLAELAAFEAANAANAEDAAGGAALPLFGARLGAGHIGAVAPLRRG